MASSKSFYFSDGPYLQVMQGLHAALSMPEALIKLVGNPHTGKSLLCQKFTQFLKRKDFHVIYFDTAIESPEILRGLLAREFDLPESSNFARLLEDALRLKAEKPVVLIFDDAHLLTDVTLLEIYRLAEVQVDTKRMLNIVLCGEPSLDKRLLSNTELKSLLLSVSHRFQLEPMDGEELSRFFYRFVEKAGLPGLQLDTAAMGALLKASKGYPGAALSMCKLLVASKANDSTLSPVTKDEFQRLLRQASGSEVMPSAGYLENYRQLSQLGPIVPIAAVLVIASVGFLYQQLNNNTADEEITQSTSLLESSEASPFSTQATENTVEESVDQELVTRDADQDSELELASQPETIDPVMVAANDAPELASNAAFSTSVDEPAIEEPVSDSSLALVTAQERGVATDAISLPEYEELAEEETSDGEVENAEQDSPAEQAQSVAVVEEALEETLEVLSEEPLEETPEVAPENAVAAAEELTSAVNTVTHTESDTATVEEATTEVVVTEIPTDALVDELSEAVDVWVAAWQSQSLSEYFDSYHSEFSPRYQDNQAAWRSNRQRVIGGADWIRLALTDFEFVGEEEGMLEVRFWLRYESPNYSDDTQKKLLLLQESGNWKIKEEINLQVRG